MNTTQTSIPAQSVSDHKDTRQNRYAKEHEAYYHRIGQYIPEEMDEFLSSLEQPLYQGLRNNPLKSTPQQLKEGLPFLMEPSPFAADAWYIQGSYGLHPWHIEGRYYLQEPSAGSAVNALELKPDETVLDLCAAPGGKSTQIAGQIPDGFLVSNEIEPKRAQVLLSNMERMGVENYCLTNMDPAALCSQTTEVFDKILVDAPCSGEGMMKKHEAAANWTLANVELCASRQKEILEQAWKALKPGGRLVYSTCTYAKEENEDNVAWALRHLPGARQAAVSGTWGRSGLETEGMDASMVRRIFPMDHGEGHFVAALEKIPSENQKESAASTMKEEKNQKPDPVLEKLMNEQLGPDWQQRFPYITAVKQKDKVQYFGMRHPFWKWKKGKVLRQGVYLGDLIKNRLEPAHAFFMSQSMLDGLTRTEVSLEEMDAFVHGQQLAHKTDRGYRALTYNGVPFAFGKSDGSRITNKYPKGLRLNPGSHVIETGTEQKAEV